jgi:hypothetical protein
MKTLSLAACLVVLALPAYAQSIVDDETEDMIIGQAAQNYKTCLTSAIREQALETCEPETTVADRALAACKDTESTLMSTIASLKGPKTVYRAQLLVGASKRLLARQVKQVRKEVRRDCKREFHYNKLSRERWRDSLESKD